jgi:hypothetical protein
MWNTLTMADTAGMQQAIAYVREELSRELGSDVDKRRVKLRSGGSRTFNAVSSDHQMIATITNMSGLTSGGKKPVGKLKNAISELYYLSLVDAPHRVLIVTSPDFFELITGEMSGAIADGLEIRHVPLPPALVAEISAVSARASREFS